MDAPRSRNDFRWDRSISAIWNELSDCQFPPNAPFYQKLVVLAQLKAADADDTTAGAIPGHRALSAPQGCGLPEERRVYRGRKSMAGRSNAETTGLYDRLNVDISMGEVERIGI